MWLVENKFKMPVWVFGCLNKLSLLANKAYKRHVFTETMQKYNFPTGRVAYDCRF